MRIIRGAIVHCTAGYGDIIAIQNFWKNTLKWNRKGYAIVVQQNGRRWFLDSNTKMNGYTETVSNNTYLLFTNGVAGFNADYFHIAYIGGVDPKNVNKAMNTLTPAQEQAIYDEIQNLKLFAKRNNILHPNFGVWGHRDFSLDKNGTGVIEPWERIKECPSFDVMATRLHKELSESHVVGVLPRVAANMIKPQRRYTVKSGDTLWRIAYENKVTVADLRIKNKLVNDTLRVGQVLEL